LLEGTELGCWKRFAGTTITLTAAHYQLMFPSPRDERGGELIYPISRKRMVRDSSVTSSLLDRGNAKQQIPMKLRGDSIPQIPCNSHLQPIHQLDSHRQPPHPTLKKLESMPLTRDTYQSKEKLCQTNDENRLQCHVERVEVTDEGILSLLVFLGH